MNKLEALRLARMEATHAERHLENAIMCCPTGTARDKLTDSNIAVKTALRELEKLTGVHDP